MLGQDGEHGGSREPGRRAEEPVRPSGPTARPGRDRKRWESDKNRRGKGWQGDASNVFAVVTLAGRGDGCVRAIREPAGAAGRSRTQSRLPPASQPHNRWTRTVPDTAPPPAGPIRWPRPSYTVWISVGRGGEEDTRTRASALHTRRRVMVQPSRTAVHVDTTDY